MIPALVEPYSLIGQMNINERIPSTCRIANVIRVKKEQLMVQFIGRLHGARSGGQGRFPGENES